MKLILASASPARLSLLRAAGFDPVVQVSGVDESVVVSTDPAELCLELARLKAQAVAQTLAPNRAASTGEAASAGQAVSAGDAASADQEVNADQAAGALQAVGAQTGGVAEQDRTLVLGCDSVLAFDGEILGKPADAAEATRRWEAMRGRSGVLYTGHHLIELGSGVQIGKAGATTVHFADVSDAEIAAYVGSGEPLYVAGAFTIDGLGGAFVERIEGDHGNVVGLSLPLFRRLLATVGVRVDQLWKR